MRQYLVIFSVFVFLLSTSSCRKEATSAAPNPNIIDGCEIVQAQVISTPFVAGQPITSYVNNYRYDSLGRVIWEGNGQSEDTNHYAYHGNVCDGDRSSTFQYSSGGNLLSSTGPTGSYRYTYDGNGYLQSEIYTDSVQDGHNLSYTETFYWDNKNNLSYSVLLYHSQPAPVTSTYSYYTSKPNQVLLPIATQTGRISANLPMQVVVTSGATVVSTDTYTYVWDVEGKVAQYTDQTQGQGQTVYTLIYSCH